MWTELEKDLAETMRGSVCDHHVAGISLLLAWGGREVISLREGMADREADIPMAEDTIFRLHSMTKPVTAVAAARLMEAGKLDPEQAVADFLPAFEGLPVIRIYHLMNMTSGLVYPDAGGEAGRRMGAVFEEMAGGMAAGRAYSTQEAVCLFASCPLAFAPGTGWAYGVSADVLGAVIEKAADQPLADFLERAVLSPLGMADTGFGVPSEKRTRLAAMYEETAGSCTENESGVPQPHRDGQNESGGPRPHRDRQNESGGPRPQCERQGEADRRQPYRDCQEERGRRLIRYEADELGLGHDAPWNPVFASGGAGLCGTLKDYLKFADMLMRKGEVAGSSVRLLREETVRALMQMRLTQVQQRAFDRVTMFSLGRYTYGGLMRKCLRDDLSPRLVRRGEYGWGGQAGTDFVSFPEEGFTLLIGMQKKDARMYSLGKRLRSLVLRGMT